MVRFSISVDGVHIETMYCSSKVYVIERSIIQLLEMRCSREA
jgi:hypothetical protein